MLNLIWKDLKLGIHPFFYFMPVLTGALMLVPGWLYFVVFLYFPFLTIPNMFAGFKSQNDLLYSFMLPVSKKEIVASRMTVIILLEAVHLIFAMLFGVLHQKLYPHFIYVFYGPSLGFWGLCLILLGIFNIVFFPLYYRSAYQYGFATAASIVSMCLYGTLMEYLGLKSLWFIDIFKGMGRSNLGVHSGIFLLGLLLFAVLTYLGYRLSLHYFKKVEL